MGHYLMTPKLAFTMAKVISAAIVAAAVLVTLVFSVIFPEYCTDQVRAWPARCHVRMRGQPAIAAAIPGKCPSCAAPVVRL